MSHSLSNILLHATFRTKDRFTEIPKSLWDELHAYSHGILEHLDCPSLQIGCVSDHMHICFRLNKDCSASSVIGKVKANSSRWLKQNSLPSFSWKEGYGIFSIGQSQVDHVVKYIRHQEEHHRQRTFREEFLMFIEKYDMDCDRFLLEDPDI